MPEDNSSNPWAAAFYRRQLARQYRFFIPADASVLEVGCGRGGLLALLPNRDAVFLAAGAEDADLGRTFDCIVLSDTLSAVADVQTLLDRLHRFAHGRTRLIVNFQNHLWRSLLSLASALRLRSGPRTPNWLAPDDVIGLGVLSDWQTVRRGAAIVCPVPLLGLDRLLNRFLAPAMRPLCLAMFVVARPSRTPVRLRAPSVTVIVPARNEAGTIDEVIRRVPDMGSQTEVIFVEGGSTDGTWERILEVQRAVPERDIRRWSHGMILLRMAAFAAWRMQWIG